MISTVIEQLFYFLRDIRVDESPFCDSEEKKKPATETIAGWWKRMDSNHRRRCQQIYSLPPLATWVLFHIKLELVDGFEPPTC